MSTVTREIDLEANIVPAANATGDSCCKKCFCGNKFGWRDLVMLTMEGVSTTVIVYSLFQQSYYAAGGSAYITLASLATHALWRRDSFRADFRGAVNDLQTTNGQLQITIDKTQAVVDILQRENTGLMTTRDDLERQSKELRGAYDDLDGQRQGIADKAKELEKINGQLRTRNKELHGQVSHLDDALKILKVDLQAFAAENIALKNGVSNLSAEVDELGHHGDTLSSTLENVDSRIDENVAQLGTLVHAARSTSQEVFALLTTQNEQLKKHIDGLSSAVSRLDAEDDELELKTKKLSELEAHITQARKELAATQKEFSEISAGLEIARRQWTAEREQLERVRASLTEERTELSSLQGDLSTVANRFDALGDRLEAAVGGIKRVDAEISKQFKEIEDL